MVLLYSRYEPESFINQRDYTLLSDKIICTQKQTTIVKRDWGSSEGRLKHYRPDNQKYIYLQGIPNTKVYLDYLHNLSYSSTPILTFFYYGPATYILSFSGLIPQYNPTLLTSRSNLHDHRSWTNFSSKPNSDLYAVITFENCKPSSENLRCSFGDL